MPHHDKKDKDDKKVIDYAKAFVIAGLSDSVFDANQKPEEIADFCLAIAAKIVDYEAPEPE